MVLEDLSLPSAALLLLQAIANKDEAPKAYNKMFFFIIMNDYCL
jgi:hypothetical protein